MKYSASFKLILSCNIFVIIFLRNLKSLIPSYMYVYQNYYYNSSFVYLFNEFCDVNNVIVGETEKFQFAI